MKTPRRLDFFATLSTFIVIFQPIQKTLTKYIPEISGRITLSTGENRMKVRAVVFEFIACRQTDRQTRRRTSFIILARIIPGYWFSVLRSSESLCSAENESRIRTNVNSNQKVLGLNFTKDEFGLALSLCNITLLRCVNLVYFSQNNMNLYILLRKQLSK